MTTVTLTQISLALVVSISAIIFFTRYLNLHAFFSLLFAALIFGVIVGKPILEIIISMQSGFGTLLQQIGFLVAIGSCLGIVLEKTGAMEVISQKIVSSFHAKRSTLAMTVIGVIVGIPVFCDSAFIILSKLIPNIATQAAINPVQLSLALSTGLYTTHTLVPPTPGPLAAAANLNLSDHLSMVMLLGIVVSLPVAAVSYFFSKIVSRKIVFTPATRNEVTTSTHSVAERAAWKSFLPLLLPIVLIASASLPQVIPGLSLIEPVTKLVGQPVVALLLGLLTSMLLIRRSQKKEWPTWISDALKDAGIILLITGAGGAFGAVIKTSGIDIVLKDQLTASASQGVAFLFIGYLVAAVLKTAQGSTTSAMIISSSLLAPLAVAAGFSTALQLSILTMAIGGGAMTVSHANDSYFWVVSQFGGIQPKDGFRTFTVLTLLQGFTALLTSIILFLLL